MEIGDIRVSERMRVVKWLVQPVAFADDGESLRELQVQPLQVPADEWAAFCAGGWKASLEQLRAQVEQQPAGQVTEGDEASRHA